LLLTSVPFFQALARVDVARLVGALEQVDVEAGTTIFAADDQANALYLVADGRLSVSLDGAVVTEIEAPGHFGELGLLLRRRTASVEALTRATLWRLPKERFEQIVRERPEIGLSAARSLAALLDRRSRERVGAPVDERVDAAESPSPRSRAGRPFLRLALAAAVPVVLWRLPAPHGLTRDGLHVGLIVLGAAVAWLLEAVPDFAVALLMASAWGIAGLASPATALGGFASSAWIVAVGGVGIAAAMARSGLLFRIALLFLRTFPPTRVGQTLALLIGGAVVTPLVPLGLARVAAIAPVTRELALAVDPHGRGRARTGLGLAGLIGYSSFSSIFLSGLAMNFVVVGLLPAHDRRRFDWLTWLYAAAPVGLIVLAGAAALLVFGYRSDGDTRVDADSLRRQRRALGRASRPELAALAGVAVLLGGLVLQPAVDIDTTWFALAALAVVVSGGALDTLSFRTGIDWGFLVLFGILLGAAPVLRATRADAWVADELVRVMRPAGSPGLVLIALATIVVLVRIVLPWIPATLLLAVALVPAAPRLGLNPWVVGFVVLVAANTWLLPRQSELYRVAREGTRGELFDDRDAFRAGLAMTLLTLVAIAAAVPYWDAIGVLRP